MWFHNYPYPLGTILERKSNKPNIVQLIGKDSCQAGFLYNVLVLADLKNPGGNREIIFVSELKQNYSIFKGKR